MSYEQLLQLCVRQTVDNKALKVSVQWLAASKEASIASSKEEAARQAAVIAKLQAENASLRTTNTSQAATIRCLKKQTSDLQQQLDSAQCGAGKWRASFALLKMQTEKKYAALPQESAAVIDKWAAHSKKSQQQAETAVPSATEWVGCELQAAAGGATQLCTLKCSLNPSNACLRQPIKPKGNETVHCARADNAHNEHGQVS
jgi:hypothetical protein